MSSAPLLSRRPPGLALIPQARAPREPEIEGESRVVAAGGGSAWTSAMRHVRVDRTVSRYRYRARLAPSENRRRLAFQNGSGASRRTFAPRVRTDMRTTYLPRVTAADHEALRRLVDSYPADSYEKWLFLQAKEIANWQKSGWKVVLIDVGADDFLRYCRDTGASPNFHTFRGIASAKAIGKFF
jgi:hypothetical protein